MWYEHPEIYWIDWGQLHPTITVDSQGKTCTVSYGPSASNAGTAYNESYLSPDKQTVTITPEELRQQYEEFMQKVESVIRQIIRPDMTLYEKYEAINRWLIEHNTYPQDTSLGSMNNKRSAYNAIMSENSADGPVCIGYSFGFQMLANAADLQSVFILGKVKTPASISHGWNRVKMDDGNYYDIDSTWNDSTGSSTSSEKYFFLMGKTSALPPHYSPATSYGNNYGENHTPSSIGAIDYPALSADPYANDKAASVNGIFYDTLQDAVDDARSGDTVKLNAALSGSLTLTSPLAIDKEIILDLNGKAIEGNTADALISITSAGSLTIDDSTYITDSGYGPNGTISQAQDAHIIDNSQGGTVTIKNGKLQNLNNKLIEGTYNVFASSKILASVGSP